MKKIFISGLLNIETTLKIDEFPIKYNPIEYPFFGINSAVSGVGYNIAKALKTLGNDVLLTSMLGNDTNGKCVLSELKEIDIDTSNISLRLKQTPISVVLYDNSGRRKIYCDLKDIQDMKIDEKIAEPLIKESDIAIICNTNMNRGLLKIAKALGKTIVTDVHVLTNVDDDYNREFMEYADILFLSDEGVGNNWEEMISRLKDRYNCSIIVMGRGSKGAAIYTRDTDNIIMFDAVSATKVVNTVGAGDALFSAFVSYFVSGSDAFEALKYAQIFASYKIGTDGAANGFVTREVIESFK